jgi:tRNA-modifying protein YgfZ
MEPYAAAREGAGLFGLPDRALIAVSGPLRQKFLHNIVSNDVSSRTAGQGTRAAVMDVKGHLLAFLRVLVETDEVLVEVAGGRADAVEGLFVHYRVAAPVRFRRIEAAVLAVVGPLATAVLRDAGAEMPDLAAESHAVVAVGGAQVRVARAGDLPARGFVLHVPPDARDAVASSLRSAGAVTLPPEVVDVLRIEDGRPWYGPDVSEENLLHETTLVGEYHSPVKGCYVGQEVIARLEARGGHVNKLLRGLRMGAAASAGERIHAGGKEVGRITTAGVSPERGAIAMGYVHRSAAEPGTVVEAGSGTATVARLPLRQ